MQATNQELNDEPTGSGGKNVIIPTPTIIRVDATNHQVAIARKISIAWTIQRQAIATAIRPNSIKDTRREPGSGMEIEQHRELGAKTTD